jgi:hypothetical protein
MIFHALRHLFCVSRHKPQYCNSQKADTRQQTQSSNWHVTKWGAAVSRRMASSINKNEKGKYEMQKIM